MSSIWTAPLPSAAGAGSGGQPAGQQAFWGSVVRNSSARFDQPSPSSSPSSSQASPTPSPSESAWLGLKSKGQLSSMSTRPSPSLSQRASPHLLPSPTYLTIAVPAPSPPPSAPLSPPALDPPTMPHEPPLPGL